MIEIDPREPAFSYESKSKLGWLLILGLAAALVGVVAVLVVTGLVNNPFREAPPPPSPFADVYAALNMPPLSRAIERNAEVSRTLQILQRERCDATAVLSLGKTLKVEGHNREAAQAFYGFAMECNRQNGLLYQAADILYGLSDFDGARKISDILVTEWPENSYFHYQASHIAIGQERYGAAVIEIENTIELTPNRSTLYEEVFTNLAKAFAHLNAPCAAAASIQQWIALDPAKRDNVASKNLIADYLGQGNCAANYASGGDSFPAGPHNAALARVTINNVTGQFIIDTRANLVTLSADFAQRAGVKSDIEGFIQAANAGRRGRLGIASLVHAGRASAADVPVAMLPDDAAGLGPHIDGVLGASFLSRFNVEISSTMMTLSPRH